METKKFSSWWWVGLLIGLGILGAILFAYSDGAGVSGVLSGKTLSVPLVAFAALLDSINPCAFSVLFLTIAFLFSLGKSRAHILRVGLLYVSGIFIVYTGIGLSILRALTFFDIPNFMGKVGASILIAFGIIGVLSEIFPKFPIKFKIPASAHPKLAKFIEKGSAPAALILGTLVALYEFPCTGGPYLTILGLLHDSGTRTLGFGYLLFYNAIFVLPLIIILGVASNEALYRRFEAWKHANLSTAELVTGIVMIILGLVIFFA